MPMETTEIVICGCGPTGAMLSCCLGRMGIKHIILDQAPSVTTDPRGIALDEDGLRALQAVGVYNDIYTKIGSCMGLFLFIGGVHSSLDTAPFTRMDYGTSEGGTGHVGFICHKQPVLEEALRGVMGGFGECELRTGCTVVGIEEDEGGVVVRYTNDGVEHLVRAQFLVGADGKTGFTRKNYLEPRGVIMEQSSSAPYKETWVALNWEITLPTPETHPEFPLWAQGYTPEQVYDLFFPPNFRFLCNPQRPAVCGRFGLPSDHLWRFEFVVQQGECAEQMASAEALQSVVFPYLTHPKGRYGLSQDITFPADCIRTLRCRPFVFSARSCNIWALGRTILCGDSAHVFPPFGGQGITSGFRDATSLAWRLAILVKDKHKQKIDHNRILRAWYRERKQQLERSLAATVENGKLVTEGNAIKVALRNTVFAILQLVPSWRRWCEKGARRDGMARYAYEDGFHFLPAFGGGVLVPQVYCVAGASGQVVFSDDVIFAGWKRGLFQVLVLAGGLDQVRDLRGILAAEKENENVTTWSGGYAVASEVTFLLRDQTADVGTDGVDVVRLASADEFAQSPLCKGRPAPLYYDELRLHAEVDGMFVVIRPDRFIFGAGQTVGELQAILGEIQGLFN